MMASIDQSLDNVASLVIVAGVSGAGKSTASNVLSDLGYFSIDNLPVELFSGVIKLTQEPSGKYSRTCLLLEIGSSEKRTQLMQILEELRSKSSKVTVIFLDCETPTVVKRYSETRRPHPNFNPVKDKTLTESIERERRRLHPLKEISDFVISTTNLTPHDLKRALRDFADSLNPDTQSQMRVNFLSFGFKYGVPADCDLVMDIRFLPNPYFVDSLREQTGLDEEVSTYVLESEKAKEFIEKYDSLLSFLIPQYQFEGKSHLNIGIGCTGGKHRSPAMATKLSSLVDSDSYLVSVKHRDIERSGTKHK